VPPVPATTKPADAAPAKPAVPAVTYESAWNREIESDAALQIVAGTKHVFVTGAKARLTAMSTATGDDAWTKELSSDARLAIGDGMLFIASGEKLHALDEATGAERWSAPVPGATTGPAWSKGFVVFANGPELVAYRSADGSEVWRRHVGHETAMPVVISAGHVVTGLVSQTMVVLDLVTGAIQRRMLLAANPRELAVSDDRIYFGADDGAFYAYRFTSEDPAWVGDVHVNIVGAPVVGDRCVFAAFMDNTVRAFERGPGRACFSARPLTGRPAVAPMLSGEHIVVALTSGELVVLIAKDGKPVKAPAAAGEAPAAAPTSTLQALAASPDASSIYVVSVGGDQRRVLTARRRK
jgi:outer membrane protein assembly factor BamB